MKKAAIVYCTKHGQTEKIAYRLRNRLVEKNISVQMFALDEAPETLDPTFDTVIVGGPIYIGKYPPALVDWVARHRRELAHRLTGFFSVSLNAADERPNCRIVDHQLLTKFLTESGWKPTFVASFAGALNYTKYNWVMRRLMRWISKSAHGPTDMARDYELTDWNKVTAFADALLGTFDSQTLEHQFRLHS